MTERFVTSIRIDEEVWKDAKKRAIDLGLDVSEYLEKLVKKDLKIR